jgi:hypothetical protein
VAFTARGVARLARGAQPRARRPGEYRAHGACVQRRRRLAATAELARRRAAREKTYDAQVTVVGAAIRQRMAPPETTRRSMGCRGEEGRPVSRVRRSGRRARVGTGRATAAKPVSQKTLTGEMPGPA